MPATTVTPDTLPDLGMLARARAALRRADAWMAAPLSAQQVVLRLSLYLVVAANWPLWLQVARIGGAPSLYLRSVAALAVLIVCGMVAILAFTAWTRGMKPVWWLVVLVAGLVTIHVVQNDRRAREVAEVDAALLTDDLPPSAYADPGFVQFLKSSH